MTHTDRIRFIFWLAVLALIVVGFAAEALLKETVCVGSQIADRTSVTVYPTECS